MAHPWQVVRVHALVELGERHTVGVQAEAPHETFADADAEAGGLHFPEAFRGAFQDQFEGTLHLQATLLAGLQLLPGVLNFLGHLGHFLDHREWCCRPPLADCEAAHHADYAVDRLRQLTAQAPRAQPQPAAEQQIEEHQASDQQVADLQILFGQSVGLAEDVGLVHHHQQQTPAGLRNLAPDHQLGPTAQLHLLYAMRSLGHGLLQRAQALLAVQFEVGGLSTSRLTASA